MKPLVTRDTDRAGIGALIVLMLFGMLVILLAAVYIIFTAQPAPVYVPGVML